MKPLKKPTPQRRRLSHLKNLFILAITGLLLYGLLSGFVNNQSPWLLNRRNPSAVAKAQLIELWTDEVLLPSGLGSVDDQGNFTAWIHTQTTGTTLFIDTNQPPRNSANIILKEYSLFVYGDATRQIWLHRDQKNLLVYDDSNVIWEHRFDTWPENAWANQDGYVLVSNIVENPDWKVTLFDPQGNLLWQYNTPKYHTMSAIIAPQGNGILLTTRSVEAPFTTEFILLDRQGLVVDQLILPAASTNTSALNSGGTSAVVTADQYMYFLQNSAPPAALAMTQLPKLDETPSEVDEEETLLSLPGPITSLVLNEKNNNIVAVCWDQVNKKGFLVYLSNEQEILWSVPLSEKPLTLALHPSGFAIYGGSSHSIFAYTNQGGVIWQHTVSASSLLNLSFSPDGEYIVGLDDNGKLILWRAP